VATIASPLPKTGLRSASRRFLTKARQDEDVEVLVETSAGADVCSEHRASMTSCPCRSGFSTRAGKSVAAERPDITLALSRNPCAPVLQSGFDPASSLGAAGHYQLRVAAQDKAKTRQGARTWTSMRPTSPRIPRVKRHRVRFDGLEFAGLPAPKGPVQRRVRRNRRRSGIFGGRRDHRVRRGV